MNHIDIQIAKLAAGLEGYGEEVLGFGEDTSTNSKSKKKIFEFFESRKPKDRTKQVLDFINNYYANNAEALADGLVEHHIIFGSIQKERLLACYGITENDWKEFRKKNKGLIKNEVGVNHPEYFGLYFSYLENKYNQIFMDMLSVIELGSKFNKFFPLGVGNPMRMKYHIENLSMKDGIKKHGTLFLSTQDQTKVALERTLKSTIRGPKGNTDDVAQRVIYRISNNINQSFRIFTNKYHQLKDEILLTQSEMIGDERVSLSNNSVMVDNLKIMIQNYSASSVDYKVLDTIKCNSKAKKYIFKRIFMNEKRDYLYELCKIYIDYYVSGNGDDWNTMKRDFVKKCLNARMKGNEMKLLEKDIEKEVKQYIKEYKEIDSDLGDLSGPNGVTNTIRDIKTYAIIKCRNFMNDLN